MTDQKPSDALTKRPRRLRAALIAAGTVVALSGVGASAYAINQAQAEPEPTTTEAAIAELPNVEPLASFSFVAVDGLSITVDGSNSIDPDGDLVSYGWDFGDGQTGEGASVVHSFVDYGTFTVTLTVTDDEGATGTFGASVTLNAPPPPPPTPQNDPGAGSSGCPSGAFIAQGGEGVELLCMWNICRNLTLPDPTHPECDAAFKP